MDKQIVIYPYNVILCKNKKGQNEDTYNDMKESVLSKYFTEQKKPETKEYILWDSFHMRFKKRPDQSIGTRGREHVIPRSHEGTLWGNENVLYL